MTALERLIRDATSAAQWRGHEIVWTDRDERRAAGDCACGAGVSVDTRPAPNGIDIGGSAVAVNHLALGPLVNGERFAPGYTFEAAAYEQATRGKS